MAVVACCWCIPYRLALMLALTFGPYVLTFAPCILTCAPCACGVSLLSSGANIPLAQVVVVTSCTLRWWYFFIQPLAQTLYLHSGNLHCVVVVNGGGIYIYILNCNLHCIYLSYVVLGHGANLCRVQNGQDGRPLRSRCVRLKYSLWTASNEKEVVRYEADTPTSHPGKDTGIGRRNSAN